MSEAKLTIKIENKKPVELTDFTDSFSEKVSLPKNSEFLSSSTEILLFERAISSFFLAIILSNIFILLMVDGCQLMD